MSTRAPRYLTRRPAPAPSKDPAQAMLEAYGIAEYVPETATITWTRAGIIIDTLLQGPDGRLVLHEGDRGRGVEPVIVQRFYPHPGGPR